MAISVNALGYYALTLWANTFDVSAPELRAYYKATYGDLGIDSLGRLMQGLNTTAVTNAMEDVGDNVKDLARPTMADLNAALLKASGQTPSFVDAAVGAVGDTVEAAGSILKIGSFVTIIGVAGLAFFLYKSGILKDIVGGYAKAWIPKN